MGLVQRFEGAARDTGESHERNRHPHRHELGKARLHHRRGVRRRVRRRDRPGDRRVGDGRPRPQHDADAWERRLHPSSLLQSLNALSPELQSVDVSAGPASPQSVNALSPELPASAIAHWSHAEGLTGLSPASLHQSVNVSPAPQSPQSVNALSPELQSVDVSTTPLHADAVPGSVERRRMSPDRPVLNESTATHGPDGRSGPPARGGRATRPQRHRRRDAKMPGGGADDEPHVDRAGPRASAPRCRAS